MIRCRQRKPSWPQLLLACVLLFTMTSRGAQAFENIKADAKDDVVYFNAWAGNDQINRYIKSQAEIFLKTTGIRVVHVKVADYQLVLKKIQAEAKAGNVEKGSVDVLWANGENFAALKKQNLLFGPITKLIPNFKYIDEKDPNYNFDFSVPTEGYEFPWGKAQFVFIWNKELTPTAPSTAQELLEFAKKNPGKVTYVKPPQFHGTTFLKQILLDIANDQSVFQKSCKEVDLPALSKPLWEYLDTLHPFLWRKGGSFPLSVQSMHQMLLDKELLVSMSFNPLESDALVLKKELPPQSYSATFSKGGIGNVHFLSIPFNALHRKAALAWIQHLASPEAQLAKADIGNWGDPTVLDLNRLPEPLRKKFPQRTLKGTLVPEPNACWVDYLQDEWVKRYGVGQKH